MVCAEDDIISTVDDRENLTENVTERLGIEVVDNWEGDFLDDMYRDINEEWDDVGDKVSASLFKSITRLSLFKFSGDHLQGKARVRRRIYDNYDINNSFTVSDHFTLPMTIPVYATPAVSVGGINAQLRLATTIGLEAVNIRQVSTSNFHLLPTLNDLKKVLHMNVENMQEDRELERLIKEAEVLNGSDSYYSLIETDEASALTDIFSARSPRIVAALNNYLNLVAHPLRLPLTVASFERLDNGEISSYSLDGGVTLAGSAGWGITDEVQIGANLTTYLSGHFQISVLKENENFARVKLNARAANGKTAGLGIVHPDIVTFKGFIIDGHKVLDQKEEIIPFNFSVKSEHSHSFDVTYRFDMTNGFAQAAYRRAVFGNMLLAERYSNIEGRGVLKIVEQRTENYGTHAESKIKLGFLYDRSVSQQKVVSRAYVDLPSGERLILSALNINSREFDSLWNSSESHTYRFNTTIDPMIYHQTDDGGALLNIDVKINDSKTTGEELNTYITELKNATGTDYSFPLLPLYSPNFVPGEDGEPVRVQNSVSNFGRSQFYYRLGFTRNQLVTFRDYPEELRWNLLERAYFVPEGSWSTGFKRAMFAAKYSVATLLNAPLALFDQHIKNGGKLMSAKIFMNNWKKIEEARNIDELLHSIVELFASKNFSAEFIRVIKFANAGSEVSYFFTARSDSTFGSVTRVGKPIATLDSVLAEAQNASKLDGKGKIQFNEETPIRFNDMRISVDRDANKVYVDFDLNEVPKYIFIQVDKSSNWKTYRTLFKTVVVNSSTLGIVKAGHNRLEISLDSNRALIRDLAAALITKSPDAYKSITFAATNNPDHWGYLTSARVKLF